jgi:general secretion pathway protein I
VRRKRGFTLLEMIVATVIMSIAVVGMLSGLAGATRNAARLRDYDRVAELARLRMNDLLVDPLFRPDAALNGTFDPSITSGLEAGWEARVTNFEQAPPAHPPMPGEMVLDRVVLDVWWMIGGTRRTFEVETVRRRVVMPQDVPAGAGQ